LDLCQKEQSLYLDSQDPYEFTVLRASEKKKYLVFFVAVSDMLGRQALDFLFILPIFLVSLTIHEYAHAWVAYRYGDDTAKRMGRLTLNPLAHISLLGTIIMPLLVRFGWAKPIPVNFSILTKSQIFNVAAAGPAANVLLAFVLTVAFHLFGFGATSLLGNLVLLAILFNIILAVFNLIPIPPLDGSKMVYARLKSPQAINTYNKLAPFGMLFLIGFLFLGGFRFIILSVVPVFYALLGLPPPALTIEQAKENEEENYGKFEEGTSGTSCSQKTITPSARRFARRHTC
jgi:Zn-dependent protease